MLKRFLGRPRNRGLAPLVALRASSSTSGRKKSARRGAQPQIAIFASEVAAIIGENPYRSLAQTLPGVLLRTHKEGTYVGDMIRSAGVQTEADHFEASLRRTGTEDIVKTALKSVKARSAESGAAGLEELHREIDRELGDAAEKQPDDARRAEAESVRKEIRTKLNQEFGSVQEDAAVADLEKQNLATKATEAVETAMRELGARAKLSARETHKISSETADAVREEIQSVRVEQSGDIDKKFTPEVLASISERAVAAKVATSQALNPRDKTHFRESVLPELRAKMSGDVSASKVSANNTQWYFRKLGTTSRSNMKWGVGGRIDGFSNGKLVEIKNRVRKIPDRLPSYDMVQVQTYMHILKLPECVVLQRLKNRTQESSTMNVASWSSRDWHTRIADRLQIFVDFVDELTVPTEVLGSEAHIDEVSKQEVLSALASTNRVQAREKDPEFESIVRGAFCNFLENRDAFGVIEG
eukprot:g1440.t1